MPFQPARNSPFQSGIFSRQHDFQARRLFVRSETDIDSHDAGNGKKLLVMIREHRVDVAKRLGRLAGIHAGDTTGIQAEKKREAERGA